MADPELDASETLYRSPRFSLTRERFITDQGSVERAIIHHPGAVVMVPQPDPEHVVLVRQYRYSVRAWTLEVPAGTREEGEDPLATAQRELAEEAGYRAEAWRELLRFHPAIGVSDEEQIIYHATGLSAAEGQADHGELIAAETVALADIPALVAIGEISDGKTLIALGLIGAPVFRSSGGGG